MARGRASPEEAEDVPGGDVVPLLDDDEGEQNGRGDMTAAVCAGEGGRDGQRRSRRVGCCGWAATHAAGPARRRTS